MNKMFGFTVAAFLLLASAAFSQETEDRSVRMGDTIIVPKTAETLNSIYKFGMNASVGQSLETVWDDSGIYIYLTNSAKLSISSDDNGDSLTASGARQVKLYGLDPEYYYQDEIVSLYGRNPTWTTKEYIRIFRMKVVDAGANNGAIGDIYAGTGSVVAGIPSNVYAKINAGWNQTLMAIYTIPAGKTGVLLHWSIAFGRTSNEGLGCFFVRPQNEVFQVNDMVWLYQNYYDSGVPRVMAVIPEKSDVEIRAKSSTGGTETSANFMILMYDKNIR